MSRPQRKAAATVAASPVFEDLTFLFSKNATDDELLKHVTTGHGTLVASVTKKLTHYVAVPEDFTKPNAVTKKVLERTDVKIVSPNFISDSVEKKAKQDESGYSVSASSSSTTTGSSSKKRTSKDDSEEEDEEDGARSPAKVPKVADAPAVQRPAAIFDGLSFLFTKSTSDDALVGHITNGKGTVVASVTKQLTHYVASAEDLAKPTAVTKKVQARSEIHIVSPAFILDSVTANAKKDEASYAPSSSAAKSTDSKRKAESDDDDDQSDASAASKPSAKKKKDDANANVSTKDVASAKKDDEKPKLVTQIKKGRIPVDADFPYARNCHVLCKGDEIFDCLLNQTEIKNNNNKYYVIQVLKKDSSNEFYCFTKWGRVGGKGQNENKQFSSEEGAIQLFKSKFREKTGNNWDNRANFEKKSGKYFLLERDYGDDEEEEKPKDNAPKKEIPDSKLPSQVQKLMKLIFDLQEMTKAMVEIGYDANKMPLGKLNKRTIQLGYQRLKELSDAIQKNESYDSLSDLSSAFYSVIPHNFGMRRPEVLSTLVQVNNKLAMVEALADIEIATTLLEETKNMSDLNPLDLHYRSLKCELQPLDPSTETFKMIEEYTANTHAATHNSYNLKVENVFEVARDGEHDRFWKGKGGELKFHRQLLWHGSRLTNYVGILSQGLRIAPPSAPVTGYMFGKGVYFANMVSKSANYCFTSRSSNTGLLLLCEVSLGNMNELASSDYYAEDAMKKAGKHSTKGVGGTAPDPKGSKIIEDGLVVPLGKGITVEDGKYKSLLYDEFITYDISQIRIRYLVEMKFQYK